MKGTGQLHLENHTFEGIVLMKNLSFLIVFLTILIVIAAVSGCAESNDRHNGGLNETSKEKSQYIAKNYVKNFDSYKIYNLTEPVLLETKTLNCSSCWQFVYKFDLVSEKDPSVIDTATMTVIVADGEVVDAVYVQGNRY